ncbi:MAG: hypothetical protein K0S91_1182 [Nitrososphaeraceae archaeon]|nr:hypothetical protein [Nitrososphaeraceae archaeon]
MKATIMIRTCVLINLRLIDIFPNYTFSLTYLLTIFSIVLAMSKSNGMEIEEERDIGSIVQQFICRLPKKNRDVMVQVRKQFIDIFRKHGGLHYDT